MRALTASLQYLWRSGLIAGDFNLHYPNWDPAYHILSGQAEVLLDWLDSHSFVYIGPISTPTHNQGNTLDLAFSTSPLPVYTTLTSHLDSISDHYSLLIIIRWDSHTNEPIRHLRLDTLDMDIFKNTLQSGLVHCLALTDVPGITDLDSEALQITQSLQEAYSKVTKRTIGHNTGQL